MMNTVATDDISSTLGKGLAPSGPRPSLASQAQGAKNRQSSALGVGAKRQARDAAKALFGETSVSSVDHPNDRARNVEKRRVAPGRAPGSQAKVQELHKALITSLKHRAAFERDFLFIDLTPASQERKSEVVTLMLAANPKQSLGNARRHDLALVSFCLQRRALKQEPKIVQQFGDLGWPIARECVESAGHGLERLTARMQKLGWDSAL